VLSRYSYTPTSLTNWFSDNHLNYLDQILNNNFEDINIPENIFKLFQIDLVKDIKNRFVFLKHSNLQPSQINDFYFWEWQYWLEELEDYMKKEKEERDKEDGKSSSYKDTKEWRDAKSSMRGMGVNPDNISSSRFNPSGSSGFKMPKF